MDTFKEIEDIVYLDQILPGQKAEIKRIEDSAVLKKRLLELGIREGKEVFMRRTAPLGDPIEISVMGYNISLRKSEAKHIVIKIIS